MAFALRNRQEVDSEQFAQMLEHSPAKAAQARSGTLNAVRGHCAP